MLMDLLLAMFSAEDEDGTPRSRRSRIARAVGFVVLCGALLVAGAFLAQWWSEH